MSWGGGVVGLPNRACRDVYGLECRDVYILGGGGCRPTKQGM